MTNDSEKKTQEFLALVNHSLANDQLHKVLLSKYRGSEKDLQRLVIRPITLRNKTALCFVYSYKTRDITKNLSPEQGMKIIDTLLPQAFKNAQLLTDTEETNLAISKKGKASIHSSKIDPQLNNSKSQQHNREKKRYVDINRPFLSALGVTDHQQQLIPAMSRKWKQINKFIEIFSQALESSSLEKDRALQVVDFGSGKGYLTFALHDYLRHSLHNQSQVTGVELRESLASLCNSTAATLEDTGLEFICGDVKTHAPALIDVMIALHACDTATDYAIHYGIRAQADIIMCSPCCHKQIRPQLKSPAPLKPMLQYGVHLGQQAEMLTDTLRALFLEANGYRTKVFEFISLEHTNKNKMILAIKQENPGDKQAVLDQIDVIKEFYGIDEHCLETLLEDNAISTP